MYEYLSTPLNESDPEEAKIKAKIWSTKLCMCFIQWKPVIKSSWNLISIYVYLSRSEIVEMPRVVGLQSLKLFKIDGSNITNIPEYTLKNLPGPLGCCCCSYSCLDMLLLCFMLCFLLLLLMSFCSFFCCRIVVDVVISTYLLLFSSFCWNLDLLFLGLRYLHVTNSKIQRIEAGILGEIRVNRVNQNRKLIIRQSDWGLLGRILIDERCTVDFI